MLSHLIVKWLFLKLFCLNISPHRLAHCRAIFLWWATNYCQGARCDMNARQKLAGSKMSDWKVHSTRGGKRVFINTPLTMSDVIQKKKETWFTPHQRSNLTTCMQLHTKLLQFRFLSQRYACVSFALWTRDEKWNSKSALDNTSHVHTINSTCLAQLF